MIENEFNTSQPSNIEWNTTANVSEMIPGNVTPLTLSVFGSSVEYGMQSLFYENNKAFSHLRLHSWKLMSISANYLFINMTGIGLTYCKMLGAKQNGEIAIAGCEFKQINENQVKNYHSYKNYSFLKKTKNFIGFLYTLYNSKYRINFWENFVSDGELSLLLHTNDDDLNCNNLSSKDILDCIDFHLSTILYGVWRDHVQFSSRSGIWGQSLINILGRPPYSIDVYSDVAFLLSSCSDVISAQVAPMLEEISKLIIKIEDYEKFFLSESSLNAYNWLKEKNEENNFYGIKTWKKLNHFIKIQGHRCIKEAEIREISWSMQPHLLIPIIQQQIIQWNENYDDQLNQQDKSVKNDKFYCSSSVLSNLSSKPGFIKRLILRFIIPLARSSVRERERGKSIAVQIHNEFKKAYHLFAKLAVKENLIPESDLIFFMTHFELTQLVQKKNLKQIIQRAKNRQKYFPNLSDYSFPVLSQGIPKPIHKNENVDNDDEDFDNKKEFQGFPVSRGVIKATARVITSVHDASALKKGEILVVPYTDIGWTVYFPLASGLVTELGGLLSHGAVCAREYGIPCIVNLPGICSAIQTGDVIVLNGNSGTVSIVD